MYFDDRLATVLRHRATGRLAASTQFRQLLDLLGSETEGHDPKLMAAAWLRLGALGEAIPEDAKAKILREPSLRFRNPELAAHLAEDEPEVALAVIERADLSEAEWRDLIPRLPIRARGFLRMRSDLSQPTLDLLEQLGVHDRGLPAPATGTPTEHSVDPSADPNAAHKAQANLSHSIDGDSGRETGSASGPHSDLTQSLDPSEPLSTPIRPSTFASSAAVISPTIGDAPEQAGSAQTDSAQTDFTQVDSAQADSTQADSTQVDSAQADSTQADSTQADSAQAFATNDTYGADQTAVLTDPIENPPLDSAAEQTQMEPPSSSEIGALVERIEAFRRTREAEQAAQAALTGGTISNGVGNWAGGGIGTAAPHLPLGDQFGAHRQTPITGFAFTCDSNGQVDWAGRSAAPMTIGKRLASGEMRERMRLHLPLDNQPITLSGAPAISGQWFIDALPRFTQQGGRFYGYAGMFRRKQQAVGPAQSTPKEREEADRLRQLLHELRTPINAIQGFAEVIQQQLFGPTPHEYRALSASIAGDSARILAGFDEIDRLAKLEMGAMELDEGSSDFALILNQLITQLQPNLAQKNARFLWVDGYSDTPTDSSDTALYNGYGGAGGVSVGASGGSAGGASGGGAGSVSGGGTGGASGGGTGGGAGGVSGGGTDGASDGGAIGRTEAGSSGGSISGPEHGPERGPERGPEGGPEGGPERRSASGLENGADNAANSIPEMGFVPIASEDLERLIWRLFATLAALTQQGETLSLAASPLSDKIGLRITLPDMLARNDDIFAASAKKPIGGVSAGMFGTGFALRLARAEARAAGGDLERQGENIILSLGKLTKSKPDVVHKDQSNAS